MKSLLQFLLKLFTILIIKKYKPVVIGVTGSVGKTSTKDGIYEAFHDLRRIRKSAGNLNTETGAPLVFFGEKKAGKNIKEWFLILMKGLFLLIKRNKEYPEMVVVELAADRPGDIAYLTKFIKPRIAVLTAVGEVPVHIEFYKSADEVAREKEKIIDALPTKGVAILNIDDYHIAGMMKNTSSDVKKITFGFNKEADVVIKSFLSNSFDGSSLKISYQEEDFSLFLPKCIGDSFAYVVAAVFAVGIALDIESKKISERVVKIRPSKGRLNILKGKNETIILDGSYNATPASMMSALRALQGLPGKRKIAVLGDMLELGKFSKEEHRKIGRFSAEFCDYLLAVGEWKEEVKKAAVLAGMGEEKIFTFTKSEEAADKLDEIILPEDVVLVKGSQSIRTEKIVFSVMRDPERAEELLVRQDSRWISSNS